MIAANELRVGNWFFNPEGNYADEKGFQQVTTIGEQYVNAWQDMNASGGASLDKIEPIPLTPDLLETIGFKQNTDNNFWNRENNSAKFFVYTNGDYFPLRLNEEGLCFYFACEDDFFSWGGIELLSLHQLQNYYFALTGKELEINLVLA